MLMSPCRVIASQASVPLVYVPLEAVASKWYGESERLLSEVFKAAEMLPGCIIFLDELDSLATSRYEQLCALRTALRVWYHMQSTPLSLVNLVLWRDAKTIPFLFLYLFFRNIMFHVACFL